MKTGEIIRVTTSLVLFCVVVFMFCNNIGCARKGNPDPVDETRITAEQVDQLNDLKASIEPWAMTCDYEGTLYACEESSDGDSTLFNGLLCLSGDMTACEAVRLAQAYSGQWFRSPARVFDYDAAKDLEGVAATEKGTFSRDMMLGVIAYLIVSKDTLAAEGLYNFIISNEGKNKYQLCYDQAELENRCEFNYIQYRFMWNLLGLTWEAMGLEPTWEMKQAAIGDDTVLITEVQVTSPGFALHLKAVQILLRQSLISYNGLLANAAVNIAAKQHSNPFYEYVVAGKTNKAARLVLEQCPTEQPERRHQWAWQRDTAEQAWTESIGWDCIFMINLLTR